MPRSIPLVGAAVPLLLYLLTVGGSGYWLDAGEFVAATVALDISHPPGHPLALLYGKLWSWLPLGSLAFRLAVGQAIAAATAAACAAHACELSLRRCGLSDPRVLWPLSLFGAWLPALAYGVWFQAVRPEVYALQLSLLCGALTALCRVDAACARDGSAACRQSALSPLLTAVLCVGFGLTNHHLTAFLCFPALLWMAVLVARREGMTSIATCAGFGALALGVYSYLPARAGTNLPHNLGQPDNLERFYWVISAQVYARDMGQDNPQPLSERFADTLVVVLDQHHLPFVLMGLWGLYILLRRPATRALGVLWALTLLSVFGVRPWFGPVRSNPDSLGYLGAGFIALGVLAAVFVGALCTLAPVRQAAARLLPASLWALPLVALGVQLQTNYGRCDLSGFAATDSFDELRHRELPARSVVIASTPQSVFRYWSAAAAERIRPDVLVVPRPFLGYPGVSQALLSRHPELTRLLDGHRDSGRLQLEPLQELARVRPVLLELDAHTPSAWYVQLRPAGLLYSFAAQRPATIEQAAARQQRSYQRLRRELGAVEGELETKRKLLWLYFMDSLYYAQRGYPALARRALSQATALQPTDQRLGELALALDGLGPGQALDVVRFLQFD